DLPRLREVFGPRRLFLEVQRHHDADEAFAARAALAQAEALGVGVVAPNDERWLKPPAALRALFRDLPRAVRATRDIAERCAFTLADLGYTFPSYPVPAGETQQSFLEAMSWRGVGERYAPDDPILPRVRRQLMHELAIIGRLELAGYFLVVWDIVCFA